MNLPAQSQRRARRLIVVLSTIFKVRGGIPRFNQMLCLALDQLSPLLDLEVHVLSQDDGEEDYRAQGAPWRHLVFHAGGGKWAVARRTLSMCLTARPDLLLIGHTGMSPLGVACLPLVRDGFGLVAHGIEAWEEPRLSRRFSTRRASFVLAVSAYTASALARATGLRAEAMRLLPNTLDPGFENVELDQQQSSLGEAPELLVVTRLWAEEKLKGVDHTLHAFGRLAPRHPTARLRIVGKGSDKPRLVELAAGLGLNDRVIFQEDLSDVELAACYRRCAAFVLPSGQEGFGIVFLEAMRFAKPCVGGNTGGTPEVIEDGRTGYLVPYGDVPALETVLDRLLADADLRRRMGQAGKARLLQQFTFDRFRARLEGHLRELLHVQQI